MASATYQHGVGLITFTSGYTIETTAWSKSTSRGARLACVTVDEIAWTPSSEQSANQDVEVIAALTGSLVRPEGAPPRRMIVTSSAGSKRGWLWDTYSQIGGRPHDHVVVLRGSTLRFNPSISERQLERIRERDPHNYSRETSTASPTRGRTGSSPRPSTLRRARRLRPWRRATRSPTSAAATSPASATPPRWRSATSSKGPWASRRRL